MPIGNLEVMIPYQINYLTLTGQPRTLCMHFEIRERARVLGLRARNDGAHAGRRRACHDGVNIEH